MRTHKLRILFILVGLLIVSALLAGCSATSAGQEASGSLPPQIAKAVVDRTIIAEGRVLPAQSVDLQVSAPGRITELHVEEGQAVSAGQIILQLDDSAQEAAVAQAQAGLDAAQAALAVLEAGPRQETVEAAQAAVTAAKAQLTLVKAQADQTELGVEAAESGVRAAQAALDDLLAGPTASDRAIMEKQIELARNELWATQGLRDGIKGAYDRDQAQGYDVDQAEAAVGMAHVAYEIIVAQDAQLDEGARPGLVAQAQEAVIAAQNAQSQAEAAIPVAQAGVEGAKAAVAQAETQLALAKLGPSEEQLDQARAAVAQAQGALDAAEAAVEMRRLRAPTAGTLTTVTVSVGQQLTGLETVARLADLSMLEIETEDLTEIEVVAIELGQAVSVGFDALPDTHLAGTVMAISDDYTLSRGDVTYRVRIRLDEQDPRLRWGMTAIVSFE